MWSNLGWETDFVYFLNMTWNQGAPQTAPRSLTLISRDRESRILRAQTNPVKAFTEETYVLEASGMQDATVDPLAIIPPLPTRWARFWKFINQSPFVISAVMSALAIIVSWQISRQEVQSVEQQIRASFQVEEYKLRVQSYQDISEAAEKLEGAFNSQLIHQEAGIQYAASCLRGSCDIEAINSNLTKRIASLRQAQDGLASLRSLAARDDYLWPENGFQMIELGGPTFEFVPYRN